MFDNEEPLNSNIRCIEIKTLLNRRVLAGPLNSNIRCIEIRLNLL